MAFNLVGGTQDSFDFVATVASGVAIAHGDVLAINGNELLRASSSTTIHEIVGIAAETISTTVTTIKVKLIIPGQIWEADTNVNTHATNQTYESCALTNYETLNNSGDTSGDTGVFFILAPIGAVGDRKVIGEFTRLQSTSG